MIENPPNIRFAELDRYLQTLGYTHSKGKEGHEVFTHDSTDSIIVIRESTPMDWVQPTTWVGVEVNLVHKGIASEKEIQEFLETTTKPKQAAAFRGPKKSATHFYQELITKAKTLSRLDPNAPIVQRKRAEASLKKRWEEGPELPAETRKELTVEFEKIINRTVRSKTRRLSASRRNWKLVPKNKPKI